MATKLRHYRIYRRSGHIQTLGNVVFLDELDNFSVERYVSTESTRVSDADDDQQAFYQ